MSTVICTKCGVTNPDSAAFCANCGATLAAQPPASAAGTFQPVAPQQPSASQPPPPGGSAPPSSAYVPPPTGGYPPPAGAYPPPAYPAAKPMGNNTKWALGLAIAAFFCCGPFTALPGIFLAKKDMDAIASGQAPQLNDGWAKGAFYVNIVALCLFVLSVCFFWGRLGTLRHF
jgi:zinc-ribbon domain